MCFYVTPVFNQLNHLGPFIQKLKPKRFSFKSWRHCVEIVGPDGIISLKNKDQTKILFLQKNKMKN